MPGRLTSFVAAAILAACSSAAAADFSAEIADQDGRPVANAVVTLVRGAQGGVPAAATRLSANRLIDQRQETFIPLVTILPRGGSVRFANNDRTMHQVYSFSPVKQFEFTLADGQTTPAVVFDRTGIAAIGCNIHDGMIAYIFVTESPWTALTGDDGKLQIADVPAGDYNVEIWHPRLPPATRPPSARLAVGTGPAALKTALTLLPDRTGHRAHGGGY